MRHFPLSTSLIALSLASVTLASANAADIAATSRVDAVTVFPAGAEVSRTAKIKLEPGEHVIRLADLPAGALPQSIRVEGKTSGGQLQIGSVDSRRVSVERFENPAALASQRRDLEDKIEKLRAWISAGCQP